MPILCDEYDLLFAHVPKTGGTFVEKVLLGPLGGKRIAPKHGTYRLANLEREPAIRVFTVRDPVSWYQSYWAYARSSIAAAHAWPIWEHGDRRHPTFDLDTRCGTPRFEGFVRNALREFPDGFLRNTYCQFLNGSTHAMRSDRLAQDLEVVLEKAGYPNPGIVRDQPVVGRTDENWKAQATLPRRLEQRLREIENLDDLDIPYV